MVVVWSSLNMKNYLIIILLITFTGCTQGNVGSNSRDLFPGQWDEAQPAGPNKYLIRGWRSQEAINGATAFCARSNKKYELIDMTLGGQGVAARLLFSCY